MSIYSTMDLTTEEVLQEIEKRIPELKDMCRSRLVEILEAMCQTREYDERYLNDPLAYNNFWT